MGAPAILAANAESILSKINAMTAWFRNHVEGIVVTDGGTTQAGGAGTAPNIDLDVSAGFVYVNGALHNRVAAADIDADAGDVVAWGGNPRQAIGAVILETGVADDTPAWFISMGAVAAAGAAVAPTDAEITADIGHANWTRVADVTFNRTADATITVTPIDHDARPIPAPGVMQGTYPTSDV